MSFDDVSNFWNIDSDQLRGFAHYKGYGFFTDEDRWEKIGDDNLTRYKLLKMLSNKWQVNSMLEWGVGGGANAIKFCRIIKSFYGTDISSASIHECEQQLKKSEGNFEYKLVRFNINNPEEVSNLIPSVDFFLCTSVYQHFPSKEYASRITKLSYDCLNDGGIALIQVKYGQQENHSEYINKTFATFTMYSIPEFWILVSDIGFEPLSVTIEAKHRYAYFYLKKSITPPDCNNQTCLPSTRGRLVCRKTDENITSNTSKNW